jgi:FAD/FMN-containing dehydrogenase
MTATAPAHRPAYRPPKLIDWQRVQADLAPLHCESEPAVVLKKSRDFYWFSPILREQLGDKRGDLVVEPANEDELVRLARYCIEHNIPITPRGGGTGNFGQAMPLHGGIILDMTRMTGINMVRPGVVRAAAGLRLFDLEQQTVKQGWELRCHPSTWKTATVGGFIAGGTSGCGAINCGTIHEPGNVLGARVLLFQQEPRFIELRGADAQQIVHAYGTTGIISEVELALAPVMPWRDAMVRFADTRRAVEFGEVLARADGIAKKQVTIIAWGQAMYLPIKPLLKEGSAYAAVIIADQSWEPFAQMATEYGGEIVHDCVAGTKAPYIAKVDELGFGHTHFYALTRRPELAHLTPAFPGREGWDSIMHLIEHHDADAPLHIEYIRGHGDLQRHAALLLSYTTPDALNDFIHEYEARGVLFFSPHTPRVETGGMQALDPRVAAFKAEADPFGLLNPGKMPGWDAPEAGFFLRS